MSAVPEPTVVVVAAVLVDAGRLLAARRSVPAAVAGRWELPGGKVEPGEDDASGLVRECREELGVEVAVGDRVGPDVPLGGGRVLRGLRCALVSGVPQPLEDHDRLRWLGPDELLEVDWLPADRPVVSAARDLLVATVRLVLPDRETAGALAEALGTRRVERTALAGDDDESPEWAVLVEAAPTAAALAPLRALAGAHDGWVEVPEPPASQAPPLPLPDAPRRLKRPR